MKIFAFSSSYCSSSEESCFTKSPDFPYRKDTFCSNSGYESIEVVSCLETILAKSQDSVDFKEGIVDETMKIIPPSSKKFRQ